MKVIHFWWTHEDGQFREVHDFPEVVENEVLPAHAQYARPICVEEWRGNTYVDGWALPYGYRLIYIILAGGITQYKLIHWDLTLEYGRLNSTKIVRK